MSFGNESIAYSDQVDSVNSGGALHVLRVLVIWLLVEHLFCISVTRFALRSLIVVTERACTFVPL